MKKMLKDKEFLRIMMLIAIPIAAQNLITFAIQMMDTIMLGAVGQTQLTMFFPEQIMRIYTPEEAVIREGVRYLRIIVHTYVICGITSTYITTLRSIASIRIAVVVYLTSLCVNVFLNWVLIFGNLGAPALGIEGAAIATLIARVVEFIITVVYAFEGLSGSSMFFDLYPSL